MITPRRWERTRVPGSFTSAERYFGPGLDVLASDHARLQRLVDEALGARSELLAAVANGDAAATPWAIDRYASRTGELCRALARHLDDEEELVIPLLLGRG